MLFGNKGVIRCQNKKIHRHYAAEHQPDPFLVTQVRWHKAIQVERVYLMLLTYYASTIIWLFTVGLTCPPQQMPQ